jgi:hypothetical protein
MSWHFSQVLVEEYLGANSLDGEQSAPLNGTDTHGTFWSPGKTTDVLKPSRSGMTYRPSTESHGKELLTWFLEVSHARTSLPLAKEPESKESEAVCGNTWRESSVKFDRVTHSWKTHRCLWDEDLAPSSLTLPKWGMMRSGVLWERITSPHRTAETESGFLPTPRSGDVADKAGSNAKLKNGRLVRESGQNFSVSLATIAARNMWPTPQAHKTTQSGEIVNADGTEWDGLSKPHSKTTGRPITTALADALAIWPTPTCHNAKECDAPSEANRNTPTLCHLARGGDKTQPTHLNPKWVEWLMGWPLGWTDCAASATDKFRLWQHSHGIS